MKKEELNKVLEAHMHYLKNDCEGWENMSANLSYANLSYANLSYANLSCADLRGADLRYANLRYANLRGADLRGSDLRGSDLRYADISYDNLSGANLSCADLSFANLSYSDLSGVDLSYDNLRCADLRYANLRGADLSGAYLRDADLRDVNLNSVQYNGNTDFFASVCPEVGEFIAWKKVNDAIIKLRVPSEARRSSATTRKCRCEFAEVLELQNLDGTLYKYDKVVNNNYVKTIYEVGKIVRPDSWDNNRWMECSHGIHFFITRDEAVRY